MFRKTSTNKEFMVQGTCILQNKISTKNKICETLKKYKKTSNILTLNRRLKKNRKKNWLENI